MRVVVQRVAEASVTVDGRETGRIAAGLLALVGFGADDESDPVRAEADMDWLAAKLVNLRVFQDADGKMNRSVRDVGGSVLAVSQFTLFAETAKGNRPSFTRAAAPEAGRRLYDEFVARLGALLGHPVETGIFGASMRVSLVNDGPVTLTLDTRARE